ncbi:SERINE PROTEASE INHIBITOR KAZAL-TYPE FAMILY PROTEIN [Salix viminalis]|uniref:SERINE PROTEASE INHIBITOR KAZAL-TYPE FAMILY PROTEIN n=1 Tax=Salix viminalis TaxID=40686 RepID=A0A9Q0NSH1_SALVM|nr:SERINE PROTEASE INHIBITOR KAZAL-TYPE FAMILY PROTEIN [Salix viminalis]
MTSSRKPHYIMAFFDSAFRPSLTKPAAEYIHLSRTAYQPNGHLQDLSTLMFDGPRFRSLLVNGVERPDPETIPCTINCILPDFVCGTDGVTYTCGCLDAFCHGVDVVKKGKC